MSRLNKGFSFRNFMQRFYQLFVLFRIETLSDQLLKTFRLFIRNYDIKNFIQIYRDMLISSSLKRN